MILTITLVSFYLWFGDTSEISSTKQTNPSTLRQGEITFYGEDSTRIATILVEIAEDEYSRSFGLMFREDLPVNQGMLFIFENEEEQYFWMKNTPISLDMIFVNMANEIVNIEKYTEPYSTRSYPSRKKAKYVIEVIAGYTDQLNIKVGQKIAWKRYQE